jgi:hydrogenase maturation protease
MIEDDPFIIQMIENTTLIIGLGNPILGDDGVGWVVAQQLKDELVEREDIEFDFLSLGGLSLMERLTGYQKVIMIDALSTGNYPQGKVISFPLDSMVDLNAGHSSSPHDTSLRNALDVGRSMNISLPKNENIIVVAVEAANVYDFSRELSPQVADAVPHAVNLVLEILSKTKKE